MANKERSTQRITEEGKTSSAKVKDVLKQTRMDIPYSVQEVAEIINVSASTITRWENDTVEIPWPAFFELCNLYRIDPAKVVADASA